uniref:RNA exonuclease 4 n=1 Tax=Schistocephalus solidus TaxID=70667 RepID=A0A0X3PNG2_SCHSO
MPTKFPECFPQVAPPQTEQSSSKTFDGTAHRFPCTLPSKYTEVVIFSLQNRLIVGHDLKNDFRALDINHPREFRFDTANDRTLRELANLPIDKKPKLARLTYRLTGRIIQLDTHDSVEDARAAMVLYNIVSQRRLSVHPMVVLRISNSMLPTQERVHDFVYESARAPMISQKTASPRSRNTASRSLVTRIQNWIQNLQILVFLVLLATLLCQLFSSKQAS